MDRGEALRLRFAARLLAERPASVLDVGAGEGVVLAELCAAGVRALGVEAAHAKAAALVAAGRPAIAASAEALPFATGSFEWVALRHVLHHVARPREAVAQAARIASTGLALAEPWRDPELPGQPLARRIERWRRRQDRRLGRVNRKKLGPREMHALLPHPEHWTCTVEILLLDAMEDPDELAATLGELARGLAPDARDRRLLEHLLERAREHGVPRAGSAILVARRR
jgi:SAM-dependent methyltransferase